MRILFLFAISSYCLAFRYYGPVEVRHNKLILPNKKYSEKIRALYSPFIYKDELYLGGWLTDAERKEGPGADRIYIAKKDGDHWQTPEPIQWVDSDFASKDSPGKMKNFHINDPTLIGPPSSNDTDRSKWTYMYFTCLPSEHKHVSVSTWHNQVCFASKSEGNDWYNHGPVIKQFNGLNYTGAWSPSAIVVEDEIWVYYHTGSKDAKTQKDLPAQVLLTKFKPDGFTQISTTEVKYIPSRRAFTRKDQPSNQNKVQTKNLNMVNVDIAKANGKYHMITDSFNPDPEIQDRNLNLYISDDGILFSPYQRKNYLLLPGNSVRLITPHIQHIRGNIYDVYFGMPVQGRACKNQWRECLTIHKWRYRFSPLRKDGPILDRPHLLEEPRDEVPRASTEIDINDQDSSNTLIDKDQPLNFTQENNQINQPEVVVENNLEVNQELSNNTNTDSNNSSDNLPQTNLNTNQLPHDEIKQKTTECKKVCGLNRSTLQSQEYCSMDELYSSKARYLYNGECRRIEPINNRGQGSVKKENQKYFKAH